LNLAWQRVSRRDETRAGWEFFYEVYTITGRGHDADSRRSC
jgi:hypothetical protein